jgi:hypothetical protein
MKYQQPINPLTIMKTVFWIGVLCILAACSAEEPPSSPCPEVTCPEVNCPEPARFEDLWAASAHAAQDAEAFTHWDQEDPREIPVECAKCHSRPGFIDFLGIDGSTSFKTDHAAPVGTTVTCYVCHNEVVDDLTSVVFPSGIKVRELGSEVRCIECHLGLESSISVYDITGSIDPTAQDTPDEALVFINSHAISAATPFGTQVKGGFEYQGQTYKGQYIRGEEFFLCNRCHDPHTLAITLATCGECHTFDGLDPQGIRVDTTDYDGDGNHQEGIASEIDTLHGYLLETIQGYTEEVLGKAIGFSSTYPYFFVDSNGDREIDSQEAVYENRFLPWTPRLLMAAYNYNFIAHDPGAYAHNSDYALQLLYDSIADLGGNTSTITRP